MHPALRWPLSVPVLTDGVVTLRAHTPQDVDPLHELVQDPEMQRWTGVPVPQTREQSEAWALRVAPQGWDDGTARRWVIELEGRYAGNVDVRGNGAADLGFALHPWARGRGVMSAAVALAVDWTFTEGVAEVVHWRAHVGNEASLRVAHRCGFRLHGTIPDLLWERGRSIDAWTASIRFGDAPLPRTRWLDPVVELADASGRVRLRPLRDDDLPRIAEACSDPETRRWVPGLPQPYDENAAGAYRDRAVWLAATGEKVTWAVADVPDDTLLGMLTLMGLGGLDPTQAEVGYWTHPDARGRGLTAEALRLGLDWATSPVQDAGGLGLRRVSLYAAAGNTSSHGVARAAGFTPYGTQHAAEPLDDGSYDDLVGYELLA